MNFQPIIKHLFLPIVIAGSFFNAFAAEDTPQAAKAPESIISQQREQAKERMKKDAPALNQMGKT